MPHLSLRRGWAVRTLLALLFLLPASRAAFGYSVLTHEQLIDLSWQAAIVPLLRAHYPGITPAQLEEARSYAYGGCVIQDLGYYPFGDEFFSDLTHYVRSGDFVVNLFRDARNADELAFAIGALSHYYGDSIGHSEATNLSVPVEFPKLRREYGPVVTYGEDEHAHVQTEFAYDINEIAHHRLAPVHYLRHVGLKVPVRQLSMAFAQTYGPTETFSGLRVQHLNVRGYRFAVHNFLPRIAYAITVLHRAHEPADVPFPALASLQSQVDAVAAENNWALYRRKAGIGTYTLAGFLWILPKVGPLKLIAVKGPDPHTEEQYVTSVENSVQALEGGLHRLGQPGQTLANRDLDTGAPTRPGGYRLTDKTYARLLAQTTRHAGNPVPPGLRADILQYYADPAAPISTKNDPAAWARVQHDLQILQSMPTRTEAIAPMTE